MGCSTLLPRLDEVSLARRDDTELLGSAYFGEDKFAIDANSTEFDCVSGSQRVEDHSSEEVALRSKAICSLRQAQPCLFDTGVLHRWVHPPRLLSIDGTATAVIGTEIRIGTPQ